ncbi:traB domain-containing protein isoform X1 [Solanum pennellii]|uniref:TraB domain-containing protein isoform X1 n=1 Tax=Solanum pennellii TaxID=28526 RepID=A0ABM1GGL6_SOLPN|nr:traB domain-containing protein isoform X1 [Solanum pennellii]
MRILTSPFTISPPIIPRTKFHQCRVAINPPPPNFDFKSEFFSASRDAIEETHPELLDLADNGTLFLIKKNQFGPVPSWRTEFVEPEAIWLIGTNHLSMESALDVERVIRTVKPENVVVELCRSRAGIMYTSDDSDLNQPLKSNMFSLSGNGFFGAVGRSINLGGQTALALRIVLALFSSKMSSSANRSFGDEFRAARKAAEDIGAQIVLGDRPIEITLERAWTSLKWKEKTSLLLSVFGGITSSTELSTKALKESSSDDSNFQLYEKLSFSYPSLLQPLLHERDTFLAWSLKRSKAVNNCKQVVGIIGKGHMNGVIYSLVSDQGNLRFRDLAGKSPSGGLSGWTTTIFGNLVRDTIIGVLLWLLYEQLTSGLKLID